MKISSSQAAFSILRKYMVQDVEELWCMSLGPGLKLIEVKLIFKGTVDACTVHPRDILRFACITNASQIIMAHNHPSGDLNPSVQDIEFTERMVHLGQIIEIPIIDHLILSLPNYLSMAEAQTLKFQSSSS